jgi:hypothetical protein
MFIEGFAGLSLAGESGYPLSGDFDHLVHWKLVAFVGCAFAVINFVLVIYHCLLLCCTCVE